MLLKQRRIKAATIAGGIRDWPYETIRPERRRPAAMAGAIPDGSDQPRPRLKAKGNAMNIKLAIFDFCPYCQRVRILLEHYRLPHEVILIDTEQPPRGSRRHRPAARFPCCWSMTRRSWNPR